jgi:hypothetical protein
MTVPYEYYDLILFLLSLYVNVTVREIILLFNFFYQGDNFIV